MWLPLDAARDGSRGGEPVEPRHRMAPTEAAVRPFDPLRVPSQVEGQAHGHEPVELHEMLWFENLTTLSPVDGLLHDMDQPRLPVICFLLPLLRQQRKSSQR